MIEGSSGGGFRRGLGGRRMFGRFDWVWFFAVLLLAGVALLNLYSAVHGTAHSAKFNQQIVWMALGLATFGAVAALDYHAISRLAWFILALVAMSLVLVLLFGLKSKGAARWLEFGSFRIQPSEFAKIGVIVALARLLQDTGSGDISRNLAIGLSLFVLAPVALVVVQPDLGTASMVFFIIISVSLLMSSRPTWILGSLLTAAAIVARLAVKHGDKLLHKYQRNRITAFLDPEADPTGLGWHTKQSLLAVGSGRWSGKGYLSATQNKHSFLPEHWTDFPFSVWAEEWGFLGAVSLLALYAALIFWCVHVALSARDRFGTAVCLGVAAMIFWHMFVNIAMVVGLAPVVGVTLPLVSYGGSSVLTFFIAFGLVASVSARRRLGA